ncbi:hypothetical protein LPJ64_002255 [Coemansia asiatica]|uniref:RPA43 OB domain-containing protein n=1 Tax=Coemansia asiatica TaxID=1052880 RepID=A0A9W7XNG3_9FUNG|nr:hypothetical protein LPJ64_002255 [Coemansia asiatica]KAJ2858513.1 hypothetical protein FB639_005921 [Coemansia asiatica]
MGEKRKSGDKTVSSKKSKAHKQSKKSKNPSSQESSASLPIPYPESVDSSSFVECTTRLTVTLAPVYSRDFMAGVHETLNNMLLRFVPQIRGVVLSYSKVKVLTDSALISNDSPYGQLEISARLMLWRPISGMTLEGVINVQSPDHIGMLLWDTFNASIPASFIPKDKYEWRPFSDEEIASRVVPISQKDESEETTDNDDNNSIDQAISKEGSEYSDAEQSDAAAVPLDISGNKYGSGEWVFKGTSQSIGANGALEFVVVDVIRANEVLSVTGALR